MFIPATQTDVDPIKLNTPHPLPTPPSPPLTSPLPSSFHSEARVALAPSLCITDSDSSRPGREPVSVHFAALHEPVPDECLRHGPEGSGGDHPGLRQ